MQPAPAAPPSSTALTVPPVATAQVAPSNPFGGGRSYYVFPHPGQTGAPHFSGKNVTAFVEDWERLTIDMSEGFRIQRLPLYCSSRISKYLGRISGVTNGVQWQAVKEILLEEFKYDDEEQKKNTEPYLRKLVIAISKKADVSPAEYRSFTYECVERSDRLVNLGVLSEYQRTILFLKAFPDRIRNKVCRTLAIVPGNSTSVKGEFEAVRRAVLRHCSGEEAPTELFRFDDDEESHPVLEENANPVLREIVSVPAPTPAPVLAPTPTVAVPPAASISGIDELFWLIQDMRIHQLSLEKKVDERLAQMLEQRPAGTSTAPNPQTRPFSVSPHEFGNRNIPSRPPQTQFVRGCYWDGGQHNREYCKDLKKAMKQGFVHKRGAILYIGQDREPNPQRIPVPTPDSEGRVTYQRDWVAQYLRQKESELNCSA